MIGDCPNKKYKFLWSECIEKIKKKYKDKMVGYIYKD